MSRRRTRNSNSKSNLSRISEDEINELVSKLRMILPEAPPVRPNTRVSASKVLEETCSYIKSLNREVGDLSERLSQLLADSSGSNDAQAAMLLQSLLMQ